MPDFRWVDGVGERGAAEAYCARFDPPRGARRSAADAANHQSQSKVWAGKMLFYLIHICNALAELVRYIIKSVIFRIPVRLFVMVQSLIRSKT
ncbi:hypothetical protein EON65_17950 [archaeon]|nr:MAG: hypothetical protein EON65_17950 [archaeon]